MNQQENGVCELVMCVRGLRSGAQNTVRAQFGTFRKSEQS